MTAATRNTLSYFLLFICLGLSTAVLGPTLPALAKQTGAPLADMSWIFLSGALAYTLGTFLGGRLFDRLPGHPVLGLSQLSAAAVMALAPFAPSLGWLLVLWAGKGLTDGLVNTGANTLLIWTHKEKAGRYLNALHFFFGLGAFISPFLVARLIETPDGYRWAYWILAAAFALAGAQMLAVPSLPRPAHAQASADRPEGRAPTPRALVDVAALFLFFYVGAEIAFGGWLYTYAVNLNLASASQAAYLTSAFWFTFTLGRLLSIPAAGRFTPQAMISAALVGALAMLTLALAFPGSPAVLWTAALGLGFSLAPIWASGFNLAGQTLQLTARLSAYILMGDSLGSMVLPWLTGQVIGRTGPRAMPALVLASLLGNLLAFITLLALARRRTARSAPAE